MALTDLPSPEDDADAELFDEFDEEDFDDEFNEDFEPETDEEREASEAIHRGDFTNPQNVADGFGGDSAASE